MPTTLWRCGRVRTPTDPHADALLTEGSAVVWVGAQRSAPHADEVVDLDGAWVAPAFVDAHVHATSTGLALTGLDLTDAPSLAVALSRVEQAARAARGGAVLGTGWDDTRWPERRAPTSAELDRASYGGVVYLARTDVHSAVASSALLATAPEAAAAQGFLPDGLVRQAAHHVVRRAAYAAVTPAQRRRAQEHTLQRAAQLGIGCVHECGGPDIAGEDDFRDVLALDHPVEVVGYWGELDGIERALDLGARGAAGDLFVDGSLGSHTAALCAPYADLDSTGAQYVDAAAVHRHVTACTRAGLQAGFHAIGDAALDAVVDGIARVVDELGAAAVRARRHRVEHAELLTQRHVEALSSYGVVASVQPGFDARWGGPAGMYAERLGAARAASMNPFGALAARGVVLALGSDSPVTPLDPWGTIRAAVRHRTPSSGLSAEAAFAAHTTGGRWAAGDAATGDLEPGAAATFAVWDAGTVRPGALPALDGPDPTCLRTVVRGVTAFRRG
ncbi:MAG: Amidohydrolase 3 [Frankiales bacterium]|nr:Amidohydrolase 3 [Frankiales bacterium]